jgi:hypothetical protein
MNREVTEMEFAKFDEALKEHHQRRLIVYHLEAANQWTRMYPHNQNEVGLDPVNRDIVIIYHKKQ